MDTENDLPGISLKDEQRQLQNIIGIAQDNLDRAKESVKKLTDDLEVKHSKAWQNVRRTNGKSSII